jgi:hypothetical protein
VSALRLILLAVAIPLLVGRTMIFGRKEGTGNPNLEIRGDAVHYIALARGDDPATVMVPFRYRILVPWIAKQLPFSPERSLQVLSMLSLIGVQALLVLAGRRLAIPTVDVAAGMVALSLMPSFLYVFHNPYLLDLFTLLMITGAFYALLRRAPLPFMVLVAVGAAGREAVLFMAPAYLVTALLARDRRPAERPLLLVLGMAPALLAFLVPRVLPALGGDGLHRYSAFYETTLRQMAPLRTPVEFIVSASTAWDWLWFAAAGGLALLGTRFVPPSIGEAGNRWAIVAIRTSFVLLFIGGLVTLVVNGGLDAGRQFLIVAPPMALATMSFGYAMRKVVPEQVYTAGLLALLICTLSTTLVRLPNPLLTEAERWSVPLWIITCLTLGVLAACFVRVARSASGRGQRL